MTEERPLQAHEEVYAAEQHMRAHHRIGDPWHQFYAHLADYLNLQAMRGKGGVYGAQATEFNRAVAIARGYLEGMKAEPGIKRELAGWVRVLQRELESATATAARIAEDLSNQ
jgi:hypothetical protein